MKKRILALLVGFAAILILLSCGKGKKSGPPSGLAERVVASQGVTAGFSFGGLVIINGSNDTLPRLSPLGAGSSPGMMVLSPSRNILAAVDSATNTVFALSTTKESAIGNVRLPGPTSSFVIPTANTIGYAAVPSATINGFAFLGAIEAMNFRKAVYVGDLVSVHGNLVRVGRTSITVRLEAWVLRRNDMQPILVTDGNFTYVSIDDQGHPQAIKQDPPPISA